MKRTVFCKQRKMDDSDSEDGHDGDEPANKKEWVRKVSTHLNFLSGFNAFPGKRPGRLNPTIIFDAVQVFFSPPYKDKHTRRMLPTL